MTGPLAPTAADAPQDGIDPRVVGPFKLTAGERGILAGMAAKIAICLRDEDYGVTLSAGPSGRPVLAITGSSPKPYWYLSCGVLNLSQPMITEKLALSRLDTLVNGCLSRQHRPPVDVNLDESGIT